MRESVVVGAASEQVRGVWVDLRHWPAFVEGFARVVQADESWPARGATLVWESIPAGRGRVREHVVADSPGEFATEIEEEALRGTQRTRFESHGEGCLVEAELDYELTGGGPLRKITDAIFIRRALAAALRRTLARFAAEAEATAPGG